MIPEPLPETFQMHSLCWVGLWVMCCEEGLMTAGQRHHQFGPSQTSPPTVDPQMPRKQLSPSV